MAKICTLFGRMNEMIRQVDNGEIATAESVETMVSDYISENVDKTYIDSLSATSIAPEFLDYGSRQFLICNGTPVTITERNDGVEGALATWEGGSQLLPVTTFVIAGRHNDDTLTNGSITMTGGTVRALFGGGLHKSHTVKCTVIAKNCTLVAGADVGGASSLTQECGCGSYYNGDPLESPCVTDESVAIYENVTSDGPFFVGGEGINYTKKAIATVTNCKFSYITCGGSNGRTDYAKLTVNGNTTAPVIQGINRGYVKEYDMAINSGTFDKLFVAGTIPFKGSKESPNGSDASGSFGTATVSVYGGTFGEFSYGGNDYEVIDTSDEEFMKKITLISSVDNVK